MAAVYRSYLQVLQERLRKATDQSVVITDGPDQKYFKSYFKNKQHQLVILCVSGGLTLCLPCEETVYNASSTYLPRNE